MSSMAAGAPLLNDYKLEFFTKRFPQTLLGGLKLRLGYYAPFYVYCNQVLVFLAPFILGGILTIISEYQVIPSVICCYVYGCLVTCIVLAVNLTVWFSSQRYSNISKLQLSHLAEEDEMEFESCCGIETFQFIFSSKKTAAQIAIQGLFSGLLGAVMFLYLLPTTLNGLYGITAVTVILYGFGWMVVCTAQYCIIASPPPEPAVFRPQLWVDITPYMRPVYVLLFGISGLITGSNSAYLQANQVLHALFPFLLILWMFGTLPPLDALFSWIVEQVLVFVLGGSPMATDLRLVVMLLLSLVPALLAIFIPSHTALIILSTMFGYTLSLDIFSIAALIKAKIINNNVEGNTSNIQKLSPKEVLITLMLLFFAVSCASIGTVLSDKVMSLESFGLVFCVILVILKCMGDLQGVYILGLVRNPLFPRSMQSMIKFDKRKEKLRYIAWLYHFLLTYVCPLLMVTFLALGLHSSKSTGFVVVITALGIVRVLRQVWQNTFSCLLDVSIVCIINTYMVTYTTAWWIKADLSVQLLVIAICRDRLQQLFQKIVFVITLVVTSIVLKKQHHKSVPSILILSVILFPVVSSIILASALLSSPLLPFFCLPVFFIGFPRPLRSWPRAGDTVICSGNDAVYYKQLTPKVTTSLSQSLAAGSLGNRQAGDHFMLRFQDRLVWIHVVECGFRYCCIVVKGLEMQETSCHTVEAARLDEVFEAAFVREDGESIIYHNPHPWNTLRPCDVARLDSYSDARNVLTGIIDQPENLRKVSENFLKTLVWVLIQDRKNCVRKSGEPLAHRELKSRETTGKSITNTEITDIRTPSRDCSRIDKVTAAACDGSAKTSPVVIPRSNSLPSINGSIWSQDSFLGNDSSFKGNFGMKHENKAKDIDSLNSFELDELAVFKKEKPRTPDVVFAGFPAIDTGKKATKTSGMFVETTNLNTVDVDETQHVKSTKTNAFISTPLHSENSYLIDLPMKWKSDLPLTDKQLKPTDTKFPVSWYNHILGSLEFSGNNEDYIASDSVLLEYYERLVSTCYAIVEVLGYPGASSFSAGAVHPLQVFGGEIPWSLHLDWLQKENVLMTLVIKAYRYAFKLMYDEAVLGELTSYEELAEYLTEYDNEWYMGKETDESWTRAVFGNKPNLFSLGRNPQDGTYTSRVLTRQTIFAPVGRLNSEAVRGLWASLALELLYFTNDDEERYSIQAHPVLLRNLTIQAADPPLGYPVYSSGLVSIPVHVSPL